MPKALQWFTKGFKVLYVYFSGHVSFLDSLSSSHADLLPFLPQGLCTCSSLGLEPSSLRCPHGSLLHLSEGPWSKGTLQPQLQPMACLTLPSHFIFLHTNHFSHVQLFVTLWIVARQAPLSMGFSKEYWSGLPCSPSGDLSVPGIEPESLTSPSLGGRFLGPHLNRKTNKQTNKTSLNDYLDEWGPKSLLSWLKTSAGIKVLGCRRAGMKQLLLWLLNMLRVQKATA